MSSCLAVAWPRSQRPADGARGAVSPHLEPGNPAAGMRSPPAWKSVADAQASSSRGPVDTSADTSSRPSKRGASASVAWLAPPPTSPDDSHRQPKSYKVTCCSLSFDLIRGLVNRLPVMITPRWVRAQPIAIEDVVAYLLHGLDLEAVGHEVSEIGGPERVTYGELMQEYARQIGVRRVMVPVPVLSPRLSSLWLGLVTPHLRASRPEADRQPPQRDGRERPGGPRAVSGASSAG